MIMVVVVVVVMCPSRVVNKADYVRCIEFECRLERLRRLRKKKLSNKKKKNKDDKTEVEKKKQSVSDTATIKRIHFIYNRALRKFRGDLALWNSYFDFCRKNGSHLRLQRAILKALQLMPKVKKGSGPQPFQSLLKRRLWPSWSRNHHSGCMLRLGSMSILETWVGQESFFREVFVSASTLTSYGWSTFDSSCPTLRI